MAQSPEYPDLAWVPPKSWTNANRTSVQVVVIHATDGSEGIRSAEDGAAYDARRTDGTSTHYFHDQDTTVQCVRTEDIAHAARRQGNLRGIQHELCGRASQNSAGWADAASAGTLRQAARQVARDCRKWGIPIRRLTPAQVATGAKGICGHVDITAAFPQDQGDHTDPGPSFPWADFIAMVQTEYEESDMPTADQIAEAVWGYKLGNSGPTSGIALQSGFALLQALTLMAKAEAAEVPPSVTQIVDGVKAAFGGSTPAEIANLLRPVLGAQAAAVGKLLAG